MNRRLLELSGGGVFEAGCQNFQHRGSLEHVLESLARSVCGVEQYPSIAGKAAALGWIIITRHVFKNGNKRTGLLACQECLTLNGYTISFEKEGAEQMVGQVGREKSGARADADRFAEIVSWVQQRMALREVVWVNFNA